MLRLYETDNEELIDKITEGTNSQNPIFERDLKANHRVQLLIRKYFLEKGYYYETHRNEYKGKQIDYNKIAYNERVFQAYISIFKSMPHEAKSSKSKIFERYFDDVFDGNDSKLPQQLLISHKLLSFIEDHAIKRYSEVKNGDEFLNHAELALAYIAGNIYPKMKSDESIVENYTLLNDVYTIAVSMLRIITAYEKNRYTDYSHNKYFKSRNFTSTFEKVITAELLSFIDRLLSSKQNNSSIDIMNFESVIDQLVSKLTSTTSFDY